jgi:hypothetical protein
LSVPTFIFLPFSLLCVLYTLYMKCTHIELAVSVCPSVWFSSNTERIWMKFRMDVMRLVSIQKS